MTIPIINLTQLDGSLGVQRSAGGALAILGPSTAGTANVPTMLGRTSDVVNQFGYGPSPEAAAYHIERTGRQVLMIKAASSTAATNGTIDVTGVTGTCVVTVSGATLANDTYDIVVQMLNDATVGTTGGKYQYSLDGGRNFVGPLSLGTSTTLSLPNTGTLSFALGAGTLKAGDKWKLSTTGPASSSTDVQNAVNALLSSKLAWSGLLVTTPVDATIAGVIDGAMTSLLAKGQPHWWIGSTRLPLSSETDATYATAMGTAFASYSTIWGSLYSGACNMTSSIPGRVFQYRRPAAWAPASREAVVSEEVNIANFIQGGALAGVQLADANGNPIVGNIDASDNSSLDDLGFATLKSDAGGIYVTRPRIFAPAGSDFYILPYRKVMNLGILSLLAYFKTRLSAPVQVNSKTGFILEEEALEIEGTAKSFLTSSLLATPKASSVSVSVSRTDNLLSTRTMTVDARIVPLVYPEAINISVGFLNPALQIIKS